jgi:hypothetical protein
LLLHAAVPLPYEEALMVVQLLRYEEALTIVQQRRDPRWRRLASRAAVTPLTAPTIHKPRMTRARASRNYECAQQDSNLRPFDS